MNNDQNVLISVVKSAITGDNSFAPKEINMQYITKISHRHKLENIVYYGLLNCGYDLSLSECSQLNKSVMKNIYLDQKQAFIISMITEEFTKNNIHYSLLKGSRLKKLYPSTDMRTMTDIDILIRVEQYDVIRSLLLKLGFRESEESVHEYIWYCQDILIEFHKQLIPSYNKDYYAFFGNGWDLMKATGENSCEYEMTKEDEFVFIFTHFAKHFRDAGIGIRYFVDLWIYLNEVELDKKYIERSFNKLRILKFYNNVRDTIEVWFEDEKPSEMTDFITEYVFHSGVRGTNENSIMSSGLLAKKYGNVISGKKLTFFRLVFPDFRRMTVKYPLLKKAPYLLPFCYIARWFEALFFRREIIAQHKRELDMQTDENINLYEENLKYMGIEYLFEEEKNIEKMHRKE